MIDHFGRQITDLRISVTQRCNLNCMYCHREGETAPGKEMSLEEIRKRVEIAARLGFDKVKITGGEPLMREDIVDIVDIIKKTGIDDISMTTNGYFLPRYARNLCKKGLTRVNIGCDTLTDVLPKNASASGISAAKKAGLKVKLNMVVLKGINDMLIGRMVEFARQQAVDLQLIELISLNNKLNRYYSLESVEEKLAEIADEVITRRIQGRKIYSIDGVNIEVVGPHKKEFCRNCTKMRITSDGRLKPCLMKDETVDFIGEESFLEAVNHKVVFNEG